MTALHVVPLLAFLLSASEILAAPPPVVLTGVVRDVDGAPVSGAAVTITSAEGRTRTVTAGDGEFALALIGERGTLTVAKSGFRTVARELTSEEVPARLEITIEPAPVAERVTVVGTRRESRLADNAASLVVLGEDDLRASPAPTLDDVLRQVPGFTLFRRSGSRTANPTTQGVSLRGSGASGASRALVLDDGVPLNDPFGGWVYWGRVPLAALARVEVLRGGGSDLWGSGALAGVVQLVRREPDAPFHGSVEASYGSQRTADVSAFAGGGRGAFRASVSAEALRTDGWIGVEESARGPVDVAARSRRSAFDLTVEARGAPGRAFVRGSYFDESRGNGTRFQVNDTVVRQLAIGAERGILGGALSLRGWSSDQDYHQTFSAVVSDRSGETPTRLQDVPADATGGSLLWSGALGPHALVAGVEARRARGESREEILLATGSRFVTAGGEERSTGAFLQDSIAVSGPLTLTVALRLDSWENRSGRTIMTPGALTRFPDRSDTAWSPRLSGHYRASTAIALSASAYGSFRAPTGNELYRDFRVGNVETRANERLAPEGLTGVEGGAMVSAGRVFARAVVFGMEIENAIANVTVSETPELVLRQRRNLGRIRSRGVEVDAEARLGARWRASAGYLFADSTVREAREEPDLVGLRTPQVARHQASARLRYEHSRIGRAALIGRWIGAQYEDDRNRLELGAFATLDAVVSRSFAPGVEAFLAAENVLGERYDVGRTPVRTVGAPRAVRVGIRLDRP